MIDEVDWYFDFISPYPYLQMALFDQIPATVKINPKPLLFPALLNHWEHKGPAEIPRKAKQTYRYTLWLAQQRGLPFLGPPRHPFNPLTLLRLSIALDDSMDVIDTIFKHVWGEGNDGQSKESIALLARKLDVDNVEALIQQTTVKNKLRQNTETAIERGVFGVPTFVANGEVFWGDDATPLLIEFLNDPKMFQREPYNRIEHMVPAAQRRVRSPVNSYSHRSKERSCAERLRTMMPLSITSIPTQSN